jgi:GT2 family glycosyltransferase
VIVVCTKNRPDEIQAFQVNLNRQVSQYLKEVIQVDGSNLESEFNPRKPRAEISLNHFEWKLLPTKNGKPSALNVAMDYLESKVEKYTAVIFLDDDIYFSLVELEKGISFLLENDLCGLSPLIINENDTCTLSKSRFGSKSPRPKEGKVNSAGENSWINQGDIQRKWVTTEWLPGGAAIYDWEKIKKLRFSPELENPKLGGYALGDDVDFSLKVSDLGEIGCLTTIQVIHSSPLSAHRDFLRIVQARGRLKAFLLQKFPKKFSLTKILAYESARSIWHLRNIGKYPSAYREITIFLREFLRHLD